MPDALTRELTAAELLSTMDAKVWAEQFMLTMKTKKPEIDEAFMLAWFANAIMAAHDLTDATLRAKLTALEQERDEAHHYLVNLFRLVAPQCQPLPTLTGVCTQIDNYIAGERQRNAALVEALKALLAAISSPNDTLRIFAKWCDEYAFREEQLAMVRKAVLDAERAALQAHATQKGVNKT